MASSFLFHLLLVVAVIRLAGSATVYSDVILGNFSASSVNYLEKGGVFLESISATFSAVLSSAAPQSPFVFSVVHSPTSTVVCRRAVHLLQQRFRAMVHPRLPGPVVALRLLDSGNLLLLDAANNSMWQSFEHPTDTLLSSQRLPNGASLSTPAGDYRLLVTDSDAVLLWSAAGDQQFWRLSSDPRSVTDFSAPVAYMAGNDSGLYLFSAEDKAVIELVLPPTKLRVMRLDLDGHFRILGYSGNNSVLAQSLVAPVGYCDLPLSCDELEVCITQTQGANCNCPKSFAAASSGGCTPADGSALVPPSSCVTNGSQEISYRSLGSGTGYFANKFANLATSGGVFLLLP
ncbi:hypothetical protein HPP92_026347 [Vanilla planifolia]|uniref:Bulb-type lectin domain-containing protein n=1 Tax=Vanilla planifolia TaxID=51239 RepID=A0A835PG82_VANPL|nr:hypothetical protein HPP92_026347 [Vanilla planifolia]